LIDIAFAGHVRKNWREAAMWTQLAERGDLAAGDVAALCAAGMESEATPVPGDQLAKYVVPLAARGWPRVG
jgi:hypothetical protein